MPRPRTDHDPPAPQVLEKALRVLEAFDTRAPEWSEVDLRRHLDIPSTTLNRILRALERYGYLLRDEAGRYRLGLAAVRLGRHATASIDLAVAVEAELRELARRIDELILLAVPELETGMARYVSAIESRKRLRVTGEVGTRVPLTAGATARALLAFQPAQQIRAVLRRPRSSLAPGTLTKLDTLRGELERTREQGWARSWEETYAGAWAIGVPLLDDAGQAFAAIGVATPTARHSAAVEDEIREAALATAARAAAKLRAGRPDRAAPG